MRFFYELERLLKYDLTGNRFSAGGAKFIAQLSQPKPLISYKIKTMKLAFILCFGVVFGGFVSDLLENYDSREKPEELEVIKCIPQIYWLYDIEATESKFRKNI